MEQNDSRTPTPIKKIKTKPVKRIQQTVATNIYILPNLLTTANMFCGFFSIIYSIRGEYLIAAYSLVAAAVFDLLDGRVARMTKTTSEFGAQYDSLCDMISFGLAPALLMYQWALQPYGRIGWLATFGYAACAALRLARFNVHAAEEKRYFQGLPTPMAAGIISSAVLCFNELEVDATRHWLLLSITFLLAITMVSQFRYRSFKDIDFKKKMPFTYLVFGVVIFIIIAIKPEVMLFVLFLTYALLGALYGVFFFKKNEKDANERS